MVRESDAPEIDVRRWLSGLRRRWGLVLAPIVGMLGGALLLSALQEPVYQAEAQVLLQPRRAESPFETTSRATQTNSDVTIDTEIEVLKSKPVHAAVAEKMGAVPEVRAHRVAKTLIVELQAQSRDPERAAAVVNEYGKTYIDMRRAQEAEEVLGAGEQVAAKITDLQGQLDQLDRRIADAPPAQRPSLTLQRDALANQQAMFKQRLDELQVEAALRSGGAQLVGPASPPSSPVRPTPVRNAVLALVVGIMVGLGLASLLEYLDDRIRSKDDLTRVAGPLPIIAVIPSVRRWSRAPRSLQLISGSDDDASAAEAYRGLRTSVQLLGVERPLTILQLTSPGAGEGKTTTLCNLAVVLGEAGARVVVVDCDLRRPRVHDAFGSPNHVGVTSVLAGQVSLREAVQNADGHRGVSVLTAGPIPPNPSELLSSRRTSELLFRLQSDFEIVLIDSPPVLPVTDAAVLSTWVEATVIIAAGGVTTRKQLRTAIERLRQVEAPLAGVVLNQGPQEEQYGYSYHYAEQPVPRSRWRRREGEVSSSRNGDGHGSAPTTSTHAASATRGSEPLESRRDQP